MFANFPKYFHSHSNSGARRFRTHSSAARTLAAFLVCAMAAAASRRPGKNPQPTLPRPYFQAVPIVDWPAEQLVKKIPELKGVEPAPSQVPLSAILEKVGQNVQRFFENFMNTASVEEIHQQRVGYNGAESLAPIKTNYLLLGIRQTGGLHLQEYRSDARGKPTVLTSGTGRGMLTQGFASVAVYFAPSHQAKSRFRLLGLQSIGGKDLPVVAFAQQAAAGEVLATFDAGGEPIPILVQGVAWIDPVHDQIVRMRTDLLAPLDGHELDQLTTDITYDEVSFKDVAKRMWLPREVTVVIKYQNTTFHNEHRYSDYRLFNVDAGSKSSSDSTAAHLE